MRSTYDYRKSSRLAWCADLERLGDMTHDQIKLGALLRIADALEALANSGELERLRVSDKARRAENERLQYKIRGLRGALTRARGKK